MVDLPLGQKTIENKWVSEVKYQVDGLNERYKARIVANSYNKKEGINYEKIFSPVVRFTSIHMILAIISHLDLELYQTDIKIVFLNIELNEKIYMDKPIGFIVEGEEYKVCKL